MASSNQLAITSTALLISWTLACAARSPTEKPPACLMADGDPVQEWLESDGYFATREGTELLVFEAANQSCLYLEGTDSCFVLDLAARQVWYPSCGFLQREMDGRLGVRRLESELQATEFLGVSWPDVQPECGKYLDLIARRPAFKGEGVVFWDCGARITLFREGAGSEGLIQGSDAPSP